MEHSLWDLTANNKAPTITSIIYSNNQAALMPDLVKNVLSDIYALLNSQFEQQITDTTIWDANDIALWLKLSTSLVKRSVIVRSDFPKAITPCHIESTSTRRWFAKDVITWAKLRSKQHSKRT